ncbi:MAG: YIP1 family protein [Bryobacteraceae bacterium]
MATSVPDLPAPHSESFFDDFVGMFNFFMDPRAAARRLPSKWFWVAPVILMSIMAIVAGIMMQPIVRHVLEVTPAPASVPPEQYQRSMAIGIKIAQIGVFLAPLGVLATVAIDALVLFATCSVMSVKASFRSLFNLSAGTSLITTLAALATAAVLVGKGEVSTQAELRPPLGLDIFMPETTSKYLLAFVGYFSVFEIWWMVMTTLIISVAFKVDKAKAFIVILPLTLLGLLARIGAAAFQR